MDGFEGRYRVERTGGALPPLVGVTKVVSGDAGSTLLLGAVGYPFRVKPRPGGLTLRYRAPLVLLVDELTPGPEGTWLGVAKLAGREYGRFRLVPTGPSPSPTIVVDAEPVTSAPGADTPPL
jgi:hypothetical protein